MVAISGSPVEIVSEFNQYLDFDRAYGTVFEVDEKGLYTGKEEFVPVADKSQIVKELISGEGYSTHHSYGVGTRIQMSASCLWWTTQSPLTQTFPSRKKPKGKNGRLLWRGRMWCMRSDKNFQ